MAPRDGEAINKGRRGLFGALMDEFKKGFDAAENAPSELPDLLNNATMADRRQVLHYGMALAGQAGLPLNISNPMDILKLPDDEKMRRLGETFDDLLKTLDTWSSLGRRMGNPESLNEIQDLLPEIFEKITTLAPYNDLIDDLADGHWDRFTERRARRMQEEFGSHKDLKTHYEQVIKDVERVLAEKGLPSLQESTKTKRFGLPAPFDDMELKDLIDPNNLSKVASGLKEMATHVKQITLSHEEMEEMREMKQRLSKPVSQEEDTPPLFAGIRFAKKEVGMNEDKDIVEQDYWSIEAIEDVDGVTPEQVSANIAVLVERLDGIPGIRAHTIAGHTLVYVGQQARDGASTKQMTSANAVMHMLAEDAVEVNVPLVVASSSRIRL